MQFITKNEALEALNSGERVQFHYEKKSIEINKNTNFEELRWGLMENLALTTNDVVNGKYSIIEERKEHFLKIEPEYFQAVRSGKKTFEIRKNDRNFQEGDTLVLQEYWVEGQQYTGDSIKRRINYITDYEQKEGYVVMAIV